MIRVQAIGRTDVGRVRDANEDAFLVGDSSFAVADGMGGHLAGEVASEEALEPVRELDGRVFPDGETAVPGVRVVGSAAAVHGLEDAIAHGRRAAEALG